ncbi:hypothetical protein evm_004646, partial [Chilo suppressalis]
MKDTTTLLTESSKLNNVSANVKLSSQDNNSCIICAYNSFGNRSHQVIRTMLVQVPDEPPEMSLAGGNGIFYETSYSNYAYEGPTNDLITISCSKKHTKGSLYWDYCFNKADGTCTYMPTVKYNQSQTITLINFFLEPELNGTDVKCIYTSHMGIQSKSTISLNLIQENHQKN